MHKLRNVNNREIIDLEVLQEDQDIYPGCIRELMHRFAGIQLSDIGQISHIREISRNPNFIKYLMEKYKGTPNEGFVRYLVTTTEEIYDFNEEMITRLEKDKAPNADKYTMKYKMALEFGAEYLSTLSDFEFLDLIKAQGLVSDAQMQSLRRTYKQIGREGLIKERYRPKEWKAISSSQMEETRQMEEKGKRANQGASQDEHSRVESDEEQR